MSPYVLLGLSVLFEVFGTTCMKLSEGFTQPVLGIVTAACCILSFTMLAFAFKDLSLVMAYGIWGGVGAFLTTLIGIIFWNDPFSIVVGIALLSKGTQDAEEAERALTQG